MAKSNGIDESYMTINSYAVYQEKENKYDIGSVVDFFDSKWDFAASGSKAVSAGLYDASAPVKTEIDDTEFYMPAFIAEYFTNIKIEEQRKTIINNALLLLLPEDLIIAKEVSGLKRAQKLIQNEKELEELLLVVSEAQKIKKFAPYLKELEDLGINLRLLTKEDEIVFKTIKETNNIGEKVNLAKIEVQYKNGDRYVSFAASGKPKTSKGNILSEPKGADIVISGNSIFERYTHMWKDIPRVNDTEVKLLEEFALKNGAKPNVVNQVFEKVKGNIKIYTQLCPCGSCSSVIKAFRKMFPNVQIEIITSTRTTFKNN